MSFFIAKATRIRLRDFRSLPTSAFHMSWVALFVSLFAWSGIGPLMAFVREEMSLSKSEVGWCLIGSIAVTIAARLVVGWLCDRIGPRLTYTWLLVVGALPVMGIALTHSFAAFLIMRMLIGLVGAAFVVTQHHTSLMFASNCVGTANGTTAGWGALGATLASFLMPALFGLLVTTLKLDPSASWRLAMVLAGLCCMAVGIAYYYFTEDTFDGSFEEVRAEGLMPPVEDLAGSFRGACLDPRVWALCAVYGACFGVELTITNIAALYFLDYFPEFHSFSPARAASLASMIVLSIGALNLFGRSLGGYGGDRFGARWGIAGRVKWLFAAVFCEGLALMVFSQSATAIFAVPALIVFGLFVKMSEGATFALVPLINRQSVGTVTGIVGAGGSAGALATAIFFNAASIPWPSTFLILGILVTAASFTMLFVRFVPATQSVRDEEPAGLVMAR